MCILLFELIILAMSSNNKVLTLFRHFHIKISFNDAKWCYDIFSFVGSFYLGTQEKQFML